MSNMNDLLKTVYADNINRQLEEAARLFKLYPPPKLTRWQKIKSKIYKLRIKLASWIAGFDINEYY